MILKCIEELMIENRLLKNRRQILDITEKLRESYAHIRILMGDELEAYAIEKGASIETLLESLENRLDELLRTEAELKEKVLKTRRVI